MRPEGLGDEPTRKKKEGGGQPPPVNTKLLGS